MARETEVKVLSGEMRTSLRPGKSHWKLGAEGLLFLFLCDVLRQANANSDDDVLLSVGKDAAISLNSEKGL